jgi:hypothetical protein
MTSPKIKNFNQRVTSKTIEMQDALSEVVKGVNRKVSHRSEVVAAILSVSDDRSWLRVKLCTGRVIDVPVSVLKNIVPLGTAKSEDESYGIASAEIDVSTDAGMLIRQMADEVLRMSRLLETAHHRLRLHEAGKTGAGAGATESQIMRPTTTLSSADTVLPETIIKIPFSGVAGFPKSVYYGKPTFQYIQQWSVFQLLNCYLTQPPIIVATGHDGNRPDRITEIQFVLDAAPGTPLGAAYNATLELDLVLVQETT